MKKTILISLVLIGALAGCSNPNKVYIKKIKQQIEKDANGLEVNYKSVAFNWVDTLYVSQKINELNKSYSSILNQILNYNSFINDIKGTGKIFSKSYLTKDRLRQIRNWEIKVGHPNKYSWGEKTSWVKDGYKNYYDYACANKSSNQWFQELCEHVKTEDSLIKEYSNIKEGNLTLIKNNLWFYKRIDHYYHSSNPNPVFKEISDRIEKLDNINSIKDSLSKLSLNHIIYYKALNDFKVNNPFLSGTRQELKKYFLFNSKFNIIGEEDYEK